jgi:hypothetical protein
MANLPCPEGNPFEVAGQARPVFAAVAGSTGARNEMETPGLVAALIAERACLADIPAIKEPHTRERGPLIDESLNEALQNHVRRSFLGQRERDPLQRLHLHGGQPTRDLVVVPYEIV